MHTPPPRTVIKKTVLIMKTLQQQWYICHKQAYGNRQQDNAEELADNINSARDGVYGIMESSFPADEIRPHDEQKERLSRENYKIFVESDCCFHRKACVQ